MKANRILFKTFFISDVFTFSGGISMLSNIEKDVVQDNQLIAKEDFYDYAIMSKAIPGSGSLNFSIVIGKEINGKAGMFWVAFGNMAPAYVLMLIATILYQFIPDTGPFQIASAILTYLNLVRGERR